MVVCDAWPFLHGQPQSENRSGLNFYEQLG